MNYKKVTFSNSLSLVILRVPEAPNITLATYLKAGFRYDPPEGSGLAHFVEHMLFAGTRKYPTHQTLAYAVERYGGWRTAYTSLDYQSHEVCLPLNKSEQGIELLFEILYASLFKEEEIEKEKGLVREEILRNKADIDKAIWDYAWQPLFFQDTPLVTPYSGTPESIQKITRKNLVSFLDNNFLPKKTVFLMAGSLEETKVERLMERYILKYQPKKKAGEKIDKIKVEQKIRVLVFPMNSTQVSLTIGFPTVEVGSNDRHVIEIIRDMLGRDFGASLPEKLRNQGGLIYTWTCFQTNLSDTGYFVFKTSTDKKNALKVVKIILTEFERIAQGKITDEEVEIAKNHLIGSLAVNLETGSDFINWYGIQELLIPDKVLHIKDQVEIYRKITKKDIVRIAKQYMTNDKINIAAVGEVRKDDLETLLDKSA